MRKLFLGFLLGFFFILGYSLSVHAQSMPTLSSQSYEIINGGNESLFNLGFTDYDLFSFASGSKFSPSFRFALGSGYVLYSDLTSIDSEDLTITRMTTEQKQTLLDQGEFWGVISNQPTQFDVTDEIFLCSYDNGYFRGNCYIDLQGNVLANSPTLAGKYLNVAFGGKQIDPSEWNQLYVDLQDQIKSNQYNLYDNGLIDITGTTYYLFTGQTASGRARDSYYLYIANQYQNGVVVPVTSTNGDRICTWYANDLSVFNFRVVKANTDNINIRVIEGNFSKNGYDYRYQVYYLEGNNYLNVAVNDYNNFLQNPYSGSLFSKDGYVYNSSLENADSVPFVPTKLGTGAEKVIQVDEDYFDYSEIQRLEQALNDLNTQVNELYNYNYGISEDNFPFYITIPDTIPSVNPSLSPLPGGNNFPNIDLNPYPDYIPDIQPDVQAVTQSFDALNIPFFRNLQYKFPFSIPFDIAQAIQNLGQLPEAPAWNFDWKIHILDRDYVYHFEGDLSDFDDLASMFRLLQFLAFVIFMGYFSYKQFF